jgi:alkylation response protein AidB-like acyl-CoA dehydrogenase
MAGYSSTSLVGKLGIKPGMRLAMIDPPGTLARDLGPLPEGCREVARGKVDYIHAFFTTRAACRRRLPGLKARLGKDGLMWISWPKRASGLQRDLDEAAVRSMGLETGLVDVKICAVDDIWSALKFVYRKVDR